MGLEYLSRGLEYLSRGFGDPGDWIIKTWFRVFERGVKVLTRGGLEYLREGTYEKGSK
jgi:hypothetical protein